MTPKKDENTPTRRGRPGYDLDSLLEVCVQQFIIHGYDATSIGILSQALGVSKSAIYHHVDSKEQLLGMALERALGGLDDVISASEAAGAVAWEQLEVLLQGALRLLVEQQANVTLLLRLRGNSPVELDALQRRRTATKRIERIVRRAQQEGSVRTDVPAQVLTRLVLGSANSLTEWYRPEGSVSPGQLVDEVSRVILDGVRARPGQQG